MKKPDPQYWLMKSEPDVYSIDDLARDGRTPWTGVRNFQARNFMRDAMRVGDVVFFHHSNAEPPGIAGLARVASAAYPDPTQFDRKSDAFEPRATREAPVWMLVDVAFERKFARLLPLEDLRGDPALSGLLLLKKGQRLSVQPVAPDHARRLLALAGG
jgi:predicted RNA-binding protein with PUA-like domain